MEVAIILILVFVAATAHEVSTTKRSAAPIKLSRPGDARTNAHWIDQRFRERSFVPDGDWVETNELWTRRYSEQRAFRLEWRVAVTAADFECTLVFVPELYQQQRILFLPIGPRVPVGCSAFLSLGRKLAQ